MINSKPYTMVTRTTRFITREEVKANPKTLYLFGDNAKRMGYGGQAKEMRGERNTFGIITKYYPATADNAYFSDDQFVQTRALITSDIVNALAHYKAGGYTSLVIPEIGVNRAQLPTRAPRTYKHLQDELQWLTDQINQIKPL